MKLIFTLIFISTIFFVNSQTSLNPGDIAVIHNQTDNPDDFTFVTFVDLAPNTGIYFTDCGANQSGFNSPVCTEGSYKYTVPPSGHLAGDIIKFDSTANSDFSVYNDSVITGGFLSSFAGDQIIVFQDGLNPSGSSNAAENPRFIFISNTASTEFSGDIADSNQTGLPNGLQNSTPPFTALGLGSGSGVEDEWDNAVYNQTYSFNSLQEAKLALTNPNHYYRTNDNIGLDATYTNAVENIPSKLTIGALSLTNYELGNLINIFPNPSSNEVYLTNNVDNAIKKIDLYDSQGKLINTLRFSDYKESFKIPSNSLSPGVYVLRIYFSNNSISKKMILK